MADNNPIDFSDLFNFNDLSSIEKGVNGINLLKKTYTDFFNSVIGGQFQRLSEQEALLQKANTELQQSTERLSTANKSHQQALLDNLKIAQQLKDAQDRLKKARDDAKKTDQVAGDAVKSLTQQYKDLKRAYEQAMAAGDTGKAKKIAADARALDGQIKQMNSTLKETKQVFQAAAGSYDELDARNKRLIVQLKAMPGGFTSTTKEAKSLRAEIASNTTTLKDYDAQINQNFRNVGNYSSAFGKLGSSITSFALGYLSIQAAFGLVSHVVDVNKQISDSLADVQRTAQLTDSEVQNLVGSLKKIDTRTSLKGLLDIAVIGGQLGIAKSELAGFTKVIDQLAVVLAGEIPGGAEAVATALGKINGVFKVQQKEGTDAGEALSKTGSAILKLGQVGLATGAFLQDFTQRVAGTADVAKISLSTILAYGATLEETGSSAEVAGTAFNRLVGTLASKRDKFFAIAKIADAKLTLKDFTDLINKDANKALQLFFEGLNKGGKDLTSFTDLLGEINLRGGPARNAIVELAKNQGLLNERISESKDAYDKGTLAAEQFEIKNNNLAGSISKLSNEFDKTLQGEGISKFFKAIVDGARTALTAVDQLFSAVNRENGFFNKLGVLFKNPTGVVEGNRLKDMFGSAQTQQRDLSRKKYDVPVEAMTADKIKPLIDQYNKAYIQALSAYREFKLALSAGVVKDPNNDLAKYRDLVDSTAYQFKYITGLYVKARDANKGYVKSVQEGDKVLADSALKSIPDIRKRLKELTAKSDSGVLGSETNKRILALRDRLKELNGGSVKQLKDGFQLLDEQIKQVQLKLQNSVIKDDADNNGKASKKTLELAKAYETLTEKLERLKAAQDRAKTVAVFGSGPLPDAKRSSESTTDLATGISSALTKSILTDAIEKDLTSYDDLALKYSKINLKILQDYKAKKTTILQYESQQLASETAQAEEEYTLQRRILINRIALATKGSKEEISLRKQVAQLDIKYANQVLETAEKVEQKRIAAIKDIFSTLKNNIKPLSEQLGAGFGEVFSTLTDTFEKFAISGKLSLQDVFETAGALANGFTQMFVDGSNARISQLETERDASLALAGNNATAKAAIETKFNKKIADEKTKQAKAEKINALFQIAINTAEAVLKVTAQTGVLAPFVVPGIIALGAIEAGIVAARPIPKFYTGRKKGPRQLGMVNDRGPEILEKDGVFRMVNGGKESATILQEGEIVHTAQETARIKKQFEAKQGPNQFFESLIAGKSIMGGAERRRNEAIAMAIASNGINQRVLAQSFNDAVKNIPLSQTIIDEDGFHDYEVRKNMRLKKQNARRTSGGRG